MPTKETKKPPKNSPKKPSIRLIKEDYDILAYVKRKKKDKDKKTE